MVEGSLFDGADVDSYRVFVQETLTLAVTLDHSPFVDFDVQLFDADTGQLIVDCGINVINWLRVLQLALTSYSI